MLVTSWTARRSRIWSSSRTPPGRRMTYFRPVREIRARVRGALHDPDRPRTSVRVVQAPAVVDVGDPVRSAVDEEQRPRLERAEHVDRAACAKPAPRPEPEHQSREPDERRPGQLARASHVLNQQRAQLAERAVEDQRLHARLARGAQQRNDGAHRVAEQTNSCTRDALAGERDDRLQLEHLLDAERDRGAVASRHSSVRIKDDVETFPPEGDCYAERALALAFVTARDDHRLRRARLAKMPGSEVDAVRGDQLDLFVVGLELEWRKAEVVEPGHSRRQKGTAVYLIRKSDKDDEQGDENEGRVSQWVHLSRSLTRTLWTGPPGGYRALAGHAFFVATEHEEQQAQAVQPAADVRIRQAAGPLEGHTTPLGPPRDGSRQVERAGRRRPAGQDEAAGHHGLRLELTDHLLETLDLGRPGRDECLVHLRIGAQLRANRVQPTLQLLTDSGDARVRREGAGQAERARGLVDRAERLDKRIVHGNPADAQNACGAVVAGASHAKHPVTECPRRLY